MKSILIWFIVVGAGVLLAGGTVEAWNRQLFNRYSRNLFRNGGGGGGGVGDSNVAGAAGNNEIDDFNALFGIGNDAGGTRGVGIGGIGGGGGVGGGGGGGIGMGNQQQQTEVYGIVEPLIEDMPCVDRPCNVNDDCCPAGVCVNTYGEGKCIYVYGRKRDFCHRNADCEASMSCLKSASGAMMCQPTPGRMLGVSGPKAFELKGYGDDCISSSDCNVAKGMCCQLQRGLNRMLPKKMCTYFRDPFMCIDIMPTEDEEIRESRFLSSFSQRRM